MYLERRTAVVVPAYNEESQITKVLTTMPDFVDEILVVDDCSSDKTSEVVRSLMAKDSRISLICHEENRGVGGAIESGYRLFLEGSCELAVVMAGDGQMDPLELPRLLEPVASGRADYAKANRLASYTDWKKIPRTRLLGNTLLSILTRFATGYWAINDSQTGYTVANRKVVGEFVSHGIYPRYGVPNDLLITCAMVGARVIDVATTPVYNVGEQSKLRPTRVALPILWLLARGFFKRLYIRSLLIDASPVAFSYTLAFVSTLLGTVWSISLLVRSLYGVTQAVEVIGAALLFVGGLILTILAIVMDMLFSEIRHRD